MCGKWSFGREAHHKHSDMGLRENKYKKVNNHCNTQSIIKHFYTLVYIVYCVSINLPAVLVK